MGRIISAHIKDNELIKWVYEKIKEQKFRNLSHAVTVALKRLKEEMEKEEKYQKRIDI